MRALDALRAVRDLPDLTVVDFAVLVALILRCDADGACFPSCETIAKDARVHVRTAKTTIAKLVAAGHLSVERRFVDGRSITSLYRLRVGVHQDHPGVADDHPAVVLDHGEGGAGSPPRVADDHREGGGRSHRSAQEICPVGTAQGTGELVLTPEPLPSEPAKSRRRSAKGMVGIRSMCPSSVDMETGIHAWCKLWGVDRHDPELPKFLDHHRKVGSLFADWAAAWRIWQRKGKEFAKTNAKAPTKERNPVQESSGFAAALRASANGRGT